MIFKNHTDFPTSFIVEAMINGMQDGVSIATVVIKNKKAGISHGNYGMYFPDIKKVTLTVPRCIPKGFRYQLQYSGKVIELNSREEFIVTVMAHELRHAWQWQVQKTHIARENKIWREIDCENFQVLMLAYWRANKHKEN